MKRPWIPILIGAFILMILSGEETYVFATQADNCNVSALYGANWTKCNFSNKVLDASRLEEQQLQHIDLHNSRLWNVNFIDANLTGSNFMSANLTGGDCTRADFTGANLQGAHFQ